MQKRRLEPLGFAIKVTTQTAVSSFRRKKETYGHQSQSRPNEVLSCPSCWHPDGISKQASRDTMGSMCRSGLLDCFDFIVRNINCFVVFVSCFDLVSFLSPPNNKGWFVRLHVESCLLKVSLEAITHPFVLQYSIILMSIWVLPLVRLQMMLQ